MIVVMRLLSSCYSCRFQVGGFCGLFDDLVNGERCNFYREVGDSDDD